MSDVIQEIEVMYFNKTCVILEIRPKIPVLSPWSKEYGPNHLGTKSCNQHGTWSNITSLFPFIILSLELISGRQTHHIKLNVVLDYYKNVNLYSF